MSDTLWAPFPSGLLVPLLLLAGFLLGAAPQSATSLRTWHHAGRTFVVLFEVAADAAIFVPLTSPLGQPHTAARITIYERAEGRLLQRGAAFDGYWTPQGCFEDDPETLVSQHVLRDEGPPQ